ncbi:hypothetical protein E2C01_052673 [Portunus trituberculatus]|uniref:Uncharacterized protein n=1 Tax=Portunus trituberculatus TaxID=210409 RepID=A0A5B7GMA8_PORTR|nr:hypothetical protein [Portunus trituberculatus]
MTTLSPLISPAAPPTRVTRWLKLCHTSPAVMPPGIVARAAPQDVSLVLTCQHDPANLRFFFQATGITTAFVTAGSSAAPGFPWPRRSFSPPGSGWRFFKREVVSGRHPSPGTRRSVARVAQVRPGGRTATPPTPRENKRPMSTPRSASRVPPPAGKGVISSNYLTSPDNKPGDIVSTSHLTRKLWIKEDTRRGIQHVGTELFAPQQIKSVASSVS